jgi:hypothetical protein
MKKTLLVTVFGVILLCTAVLMSRLIRTSDSTSRPDKTNPNATTLSDKVESTKKERIVRTASALEPEMGDTAFYISENGDPNDFWQGSQFHGTMDKVGVTKAVMDQLPGRQADFEWIRDHKADRNAYLASRGIDISAPELHWDVGIVAQGLINGKARVAVPAALGKDIAIDGGVGQESVGVLKEIWELQDGGANPILLERHSLPISSTIYTQQEAPANIPADTPPGSGT